MPRKGMGQKVSSVPGQTYGARTEQEEAQAVQPMAEMAPPPPSRPRRTPGQLGVSLSGPTTKPDELISVPARQRMPEMMKGPAIDATPYLRTAASLEALAMNPNATATTRMLARFARSALAEESGQA